MTTGKQIKKCPLIANQEDHDQKVEDKTETKKISIKLKYQDLVASTISLLAIISLILQSTLIHSP